jgi:ATP-dependent DNA ligase
VELPVNPPLEPMLAKAVPEIPVGEGMTYEPKWDGFRTLIFRDRDEVELISRGNKPMNRYFPEVIDQVRAQLPERSVFDGELVVIRRDTGGLPKLDFEQLQQRIHPAASRVAMLAEQTPAAFIAFDLLALGDESLMQERYEIRRERLAAELAHVAPPVHRTPITADPATAARWFEVFEGAGLDGVIAKPPDIPYAPGKRLMFKIKHARTADCVVAGFRWHKSGPVVGSLLLGLYADDGTLRHVGVSASFSASRRRELLDELAPYRMDSFDGHPWQAWTAQEESDRMPGAVSRWSAGKTLEWEPLRPELVVEVAYNAMEGDRFRQVAHFVRWRPDRDPRSCDYSQLERPVRFDVDRVLTGTQ